MTTAITNSNIQTAVDLWVSDESTATATYGDISTWDTSNVTNMRSLFENKTTFNSDIRGWDVSNVTDFIFMFKSASAFDQDISGWDISSATQLTEMFRNASSFNQNIGIWNVTNITNMSAMLRGASSFNQDISGWNVSNVTNMNFLLSDCRAFDQDISSWDVSGVKEMGFVFKGATIFDQDISGWDVSSATTIQEMFQNAPAFNQPIQFWNTTSVSNYTNMFQDATAMLARGFPETPTSADFNQIRPTYPCFLKGTMIETMKGMIPVEELHPNMFVKTYEHSYVPIKLIGKRTITHDSKKERNKEQLFVCKKELYPGATEDLVITGCHSLLVKRDFLEKDEEQRIIDANGGIYLTDKLVRLPAVADLQTIIYPKDGDYEIYHFALDHTDDRMNYGIYANGILAETCSIRYISEHSGMKLLK